MTISEEARRIVGELTDQEARSIGIDVMAHLEIEAMALLSRDPALAATVASGARLTNIEERIAGAGPSGDIVVPSYTFDSMEIVLSYAGFQSRPRLAVGVHGIVREMTYGDGPDAGETASPFESVFVVAQSEDGHYVIVSDAPVP